jgi:hypothetical protein
MEATVRHVPVTGSYSFGGGVAKLYVPPATSTWPEDNGVTV